MPTFNLVERGPHLKLRDTARQKKFLEVDSISKIIFSSPQ